MLGTNIRFHKNEVRFNGGINISSAGVNEIIGNTVHGARTYGIYAGGDKGLIEGNTLYNNGGYGIHLYKPGGGTANDWVIRNNVVHSNGKGFEHSMSGWQQTAGVIITRGKNNQFYNNIVYNNYKGGVSTSFGASDTLIANNTIYGNDEFGIDISDAFGGSIGARVINNISYGNRGAQLTDSGTNTTLQNNLTTDPKFVNAAGGDFHLQAGSPAIDAGQTLAEVTNDFAYGVRPWPAGGAYDIGAYEFGSPPGSGPSPPPPSGVPPAVPRPPSTYDPTKSLCPI